MGFASFFTNSLNNREVSVSCHFMRTKRKHISFSLSQIERLCQVAKALSSPLRVKMIGLLASRSMNVNELAEALSMPVSAALNVRQLEEARLISTEIQPGIHEAVSSAPGASTRSACISCPRRRTA